MHVVVAGEGELALRITEALMEDHDVVLVTTEMKAAARVEHFDVQLVEGSPTSLAVLREARTQKADYFIAASHNDERNIVGCIAAEQLGARRRVCILHTAADLRAGDALDDVSLTSSVNIDAIVRPAEQLINEILRIVKVPGALDVRSFLGGKVGLYKALVEEGAAIAGAPLAERQLPKGVRVVMLQRDGVYEAATPATVLEAGDRVTLIGKSRPMIAYARRAFRGKEHGREKRRAIICGGGTVGEGVAKGLREAGWWVKVIEESLERCQRLSEELDCLVLHGDGSDMDLLREEHVESTAVLIAVTNNDEKNLLISLIAKHLGVERIITRADRLTNERIFDKVGIDVVLNARGAAVRSVVHDIVNADREHVAELEHGELSVLDCLLPSDFQPILVGEVRPPTTAGVGAIQRGWRAIVPRDDLELRPGDHVLLVCRAGQEDATKQHLLGLGAA